VNIFKEKKKRIIFSFVIVILLFLVYLFFTVSNIVRYGYDRQNKIIEITKSIIPGHYINKIKQNLFIISNLKSQNEFLNLQVQKFEQGLDGKKYKTKIAKLNSQEYEINFFFTPFKRLDVNLGWNAETNSLRAHYAEIKDDKVILISGEGQTIYFQKKNLLKEKLNYKNLSNNILEILKKGKFELIGIRDLHFVNEKVFISMLVKNQRGITINLYEADLNYEKLIFKTFFKTEEYWDDYNVFSGGRIEDYTKNNILFAIGFSYVKNAAQDKQSLLGKIIKINLDSKNYELISIGHRNPQGLRFVEKENLIINSEHGPKGGDEINVNLLNHKKEIKNYGWDIASYGTAYDGTDPFKKSHKKFGFEEPAIYFVPSIGISEILYFENNSYCSDKCVWATSLRANSIYLHEMSDNYEKLNPIGRIHLKKNRLRDIDYDEDLDMVILLSENVPSLISLKKIKN